MKRITYLCLLLIAGLFLQTGCSAPGAATINHKQDATAAVARLENRIVALELENTDLRRRLNEAEGKMGQVEKGLGKYDQASETFEIIQLLADKVVELEEAGSQTASMPDRAPRTRTVEEIISSTPPSPVVPRPMSSPSVQSQAWPLTNGTTLSGPTTGYNSQPTPSPTARPVAPPVAENGSYYGQISPQTGQPKTVHVNGYYRKDGTYVREHYRSPPRKK